MAYFHLFLETFGLFSNLLKATGERQMEKPSLDEVLSYAKNQVRYFISKKASKYPKEFKEEIEQECYLSIIIKYNEIEAERGWKSLVYQKAHGVVQDYIKIGKGDEFSKLSVNNKNFRRAKITRNEDNEETEFSQFLGQNGIYTEDPSETVDIKWDLISRLASQDIRLRCFAMHLIGHTLEQIALVVGKEHSRVGQYIQEFIERFDDPEYSSCGWFLQTCFAFGLCEKLGIPNIDQQLGHQLPKVDLNDLNPHFTVLNNRAQMSLFNEQEPTT